MKELAKIAETVQAAETGVEPETTESATISTLERLTAIIAYVFFAVPLAIPVLVRHTGKSQFVKFHISQAINLFLANLTFLTLYGLLYLLFRETNAPHFAFQAMTTIWLIPTVLISIGIRNASQGAEKPLPLIGKSIITL